MKNNNTIEKRILDRISRKKSPILLREDFRDLAGYDQIGRTLRQLTQRGKLIKLGYGIYAKTKMSFITGEIVPVKSLPALGREAMKRLGVETTLTRAELDYKAGTSTQIPTGRMIAVKSRINRKIGYNGAFIRYELTS